MTQDVRPLGPPDAARIIPNEMAGLVELADWIGEWMQMHDLTGPASTKLRLVMEEIAVNALMHGFPSDQSGHVRVEVWNSPTSGPWWMRIADDGPAFDPLAAPPADLSETPIDDRGDGGAGLMLVHSVTDILRYERVAGWNVLEARITNDPING